MKSKLRVFYAWASVAAAVIIAVLRTVIAIQYTDKYGVYANGSLFPRIFDIAVFVVVAVMIALPYVFKAGFSECQSLSPTKLSVFSGAVLGFMFIASSALSFLNLISQNSFPALDTVIMLSGILSGIGIIMNIFFPNRYDILRSVLSFAPVLWSLASLIAVYFDMDILITSPNRVYSQTALLATALFFLTCSREMLDIKDSRFFYMSTSSAVVLSAASAVPNLICENILAVGASDKPENYAVILAVSLFSAVKLIQTAHKEQ